MNGLQRLLTGSLLVGLVCAASAGVYYVDDDGDNGNTGMTPGSPWKTITYALSQAITATSVGGTINVASGVYDEVLGETFPLVLDQGIGLRGAGVNHSIIRYGGADQCLIVAQATTEPHPVTIQRFTLEQSAYPYNSLQLYGSAIIRQNLLVSARVESRDAENTWMEDNIIVGEGIEAMVSCRGLGQDGFVRRNIFVAGETAFEDCIRLKPAAGGAITVEKNFMKGASSGIRCDLYVNPVITDNVFFNQRRYGVYINEGSQVIKNCTIWGATEGGIYRAKAGSPVIRNCVIWTDSDDLENCSATYSNIRDGDAGVGNMSQAPVFANPLAGDLHYLAGSPGIDAGFGPYASASDVDGETRPIDGDGDLIADPDMGADEYSTARPYVLIDGGAEYTMSSSVTLTMYHPDAAMMMIGNDFDLSTSIWEPYATSKSWVLDGTPCGRAIVNVVFRNSAGEIVGFVGDDILYDCTPTPTDTATDTFTPSPTSTPTDTRTPTPTNTPPPDAWLTVAGGSGVIGTSGNLVPIGLDNPEIQVRGLNFDLLDTPNALEASDVQTTVRTTGFFVAFNDKGGDGLEVVLTSLDDSLIETGSGAVVQIVYDISPSANEGEVDLTILDAHAADPENTPIALGTVDGIFLVLPEPTPTPTDTPTPTPTPKNFLAAGEGSAHPGSTDASLDIILENPDTEVRAAQFTLQDTPDRVEWTEASTTARTTGFLLAMNDIATQGVEVVLSGIKDCIAAGSGRIVTLYGTVSSEYAPATLTLEFSDAVMADCKGNPMDFRLEEGSLVVTGMKGDLDANRIVNLFDVLRLVDILLEVPPPPTDYENWAGDVLVSGELDLFDVIALIDLVLST